MIRAVLALSALSASSIVVAESPAPFAWPTPMSTSAPAPQPTVLWQTAPATLFGLTVEPLGVSPDGEARALVRVVLRDAAGAAVKLRRGADFDFVADRGAAQWQTRLRFGGPAAIVSVPDARPVAVRVVANRPVGLGSQRIAFDPRGWVLPRAVAGAIGPHLVRVGWFPRVTAGTVRVYRVDGAGRALLAATVPPPSSRWDDAAVRPSAVARYLVVTPDARTAVQADVPGELALTTVDTIRGKSAWLAFSADPLDDASFAKLDVDTIVATALRAGLRSIELRLAYGAFDESAPPAKATIDRLIDALTEHGIAVIGWTVPRANAFDDLAENAAAAAYRTPRGSRISGLAVDLERGEEFLGDGPRGYAALSAYLGLVRSAVGPHVLLVATVEDPFLEHLDEAAFPYREIARSADVLQPLTYWRMTGRWDTAAKARAAVAGSIALTRRLAERDVPIDVGAQTGVLSQRGAPPGDEVTAAVAAARAGGAVGITFYDLPGTGPEQWDAIARAAW